MIIWNFSPIEIEAKIKVVNIDSIRQQLIDEGATYLGTVLQTDTYYDRHDSWLAQNDRGLRIRRFEHIAGPFQEDARPLLTAKGPQQPASLYKARHEVQLRLDHVDDFAGILSISGFDICLTIQKRRSSYLLDSCFVELDELPLLGFFVEIEGPSDSGISAVIDKINPQGETIDNTYVHLIIDYCRLHDIDDKIISF